MNARLGALTEALSRFPINQWNLGTVGLNGGRPSSLHELASAQFPPVTWAANRDRIKQAFTDRFAAIEWALTVLSRSSDDLRALVNSIENGGNASSSPWFVLQSLSDGAAWHANVVEILNTAHARLICAMAAHAKAQGDLP